MRYVSEKEYKRRLHEIQRMNDSKLRLQKLNEQKKKYKKKKKITTSKLALWIMMAIMFEIVIFAQIIMWRFGDFSSLYVLIGIPAAMIPIVWKYYDKSAKENCANGIVYETAMKEHAADDESYDDDLNVQEIPVDQSGEDFPG